MKYSKSVGFWRYEFDAERVIYHMCDETNGFCAFLALQLKAELEKRLEKHVLTIRVRWSFVSDRVAGANFQH